MSKSLPFSVPRDTDWKDKEPCHRWFITPDRKNGGWCLHHGRYMMTNGKRIMLTDNPSPYNGTAWGGETPEGEESDYGLTLKVAAERAEGRREW